MIMLSVGILMNNLCHAAIVEIPPIVGMTGAGCVDFNLSIDSVE